MNSSSAATNARPVEQAKQTVWVLTRELNQYDQYGEYFVAVFGEAPHHTDLTEHGVPQNRLRHVLNGGGRVDYEDEWYYLRQHVVGGDAIIDGDI
jgi:hypothetical protein